MLIVDPYHCTSCGDELDAEELLKHTGLCRGCEWMQALEKDAAKSGASKKRQHVKRRG